MNDDNTRRYLVLLNLPFKFTEAELKQAYRDISQVWHPDKHDQNPRLRKKAEAVFKDVNTAYQFFTKQMHSGRYEFVETYPDGPRPAFDSGPDMEDILRTVEEELRKQYEGRIRDISDRFNAEVAELRQKHTEYVSRLSRSQDETKAQYDQRVRNLSSTLEARNMELSQEKAKAEHLQQLVRRNFCSLNVAKSVFKHGIAKPVVATAQIGTAFVRQSCALFVRLCAEHLPDRFERVLILSTLGVFVAIGTLMLAVFAPAGVLIPVACVFAIVASSVYILRSHETTNEETGTNNTSEGIRPPADGSPKPSV